MSSGRGPVGVARTYSVEVYRGLGGFGPAWRALADELGIPERRVKGVQVRRVDDKLLEVIIDLRPRSEGV